MKTADSTVGNIEKEWVIGQLNAVSRTFALSLQHLPEPLETYSSLSYLLCRIPDTIEDTPALSATEKLDLLLMYEEAFMSQDTATISSFVDEAKSAVTTSEIADPESWELVYETHKVFEAYQSFTESIQSRIQPHIQELIYGMYSTVKQHPDGVRIESIEEFDQYCYYVAGKVGHLLSELVSETYSIQLSEDILQASEEYGLLLQTVNIGKDVYDDYIEENNIYLPQTVLNSHNVPHSEVTNEHKTAGVVKTIDKLLDEFVYPHYESAEQFLSWLESAEESAVCGLAIPYFLAVATTRELEANSDLATQPTEVKISKEEVFSIISILQEQEYHSFSSLQERIHTEPL